MKCSETNCEDDAVSLREIDGRIFIGMCKKHLEEYIDKRTKEINEHLKGLEKTDFSAI